MNKPTRGQGGDICAAAEHREDEANARADKAEAIAAELTASLEALKARAALAANVVTEARHIEWKSLGLVKALSAFDRSVAPMVWGIETRNGGWLGTETIKTGSGSSVTADKAHRFATKEEAEKEANEWSLAGGMAKRIDDQPWGRGKVTP